MYLCTRIIVLSVIRSFLTTLTQTGLPFDVDDPLMKRLPGVLLPQ